MKKGMIAVVALVAGVVLLAGYFGQVTERIVKDRLANMPFGFQMEVAEYHRGWFSSTARLEWRPLAGLPLADAIPAEVPPEGSADDFPPALQELISRPLVVDIEIAHGPVFFAVGPGVGLFHARGRVALGLEAPDGTLHSPDNPPNNLEIVLSSFSGRNVRNRIEAPRLSADLGEVSLELEGFLAEGEWTGPDSFQLQNAALAGMEMTAAAGEEAVRFTLTGLEGQIEYPRGLESGAILSESETVSSIAEIRLETGDGNRVMRMAGIESLGAISLSEGGLHGFESDATVEALDIMGREFGPIRLTQSAGGFSEDALLQLLDALKDGIFDAAAAGTPEESAQTAGENDQPGPAAALPQPTPELLEAVRLLLAGSPYYRMDLVLTYGGEHSIALTLHQAFDGERVSDTADGLNIASFVAATEYFVHIEIPVVAAEELAGQALVQLGLAQGLLQQTNGDYVFSMSLRDGALELNGRPMPLPLPLPSAPPGAPRPPFEDATPPPSG